MPSDGTPTEEQEPAADEEDSEEIELELARYYIAGTNIPTDDLED